MPAAWERGAWENGNRWGSDRVTEGASSRTSPDSTVNQKRRAIHVTSSSVRARAATASKP